jgi:ubiquinone/menaquinone biosynthesis C-methylase UbiE
MIKEMESVETNKKLFSEKRAEKYEDRKLEYNFNTVPFKWHLTKAFSSIKDGLEILDIGCGTGELLRKIAQQKKGKFLGVDLSPSMIERAKDKAKDIENLSFDVMSSLHLRIKDKSFDIAIMRGALHHFPDPLKSINEAFRILKEKGELHILDILSYEEKEIDEFFNKASVLWQPANFRFYAKSKLNEFCKKAGFKKPRIFEHKITMELEKWLKTYQNYDKVKSLFLNCSKNIKKAFNLRLENGEYLIDFNSFYLIAKK